MLDFDKIESRQINQLKKQLQTLTDDIDRQVSYKTDEYRTKERSLNDQLIEYQKEVQKANQEIEM